VYLSPSAASIPTAAPMKRLPKKSLKKIQIPHNRLKTPSVVAPPALEAFCADSKMTMAMASLRIDSPKMMVYSFGSTLYELKIARIVTGSVAERVAPTEIASVHVILIFSIGSRVYSQSSTPITTAERKVPAKAKVRIVPMLRKKLAWCSS
jgi:hypothetical protein